MKNEVSLLNMSYFSTKGLYSDKIWYDILFFMRFYN